MLHFLACMINVCNEKVWVSVLWLEKISLLKRFKLKREQNTKLTWPDDEVMNTFQMLSNVAPQR